MAKNTIVKKSIFHAHEDGTTGVQVQKIVFDPEDEEHLFRLEVPGYLAKHFRLESSLLSASSVAFVVSEYERLCDEYSRWRLSMNAPWMLWLQVASTPAPFAMQSIALGMELVKLMPDGSMCTFEEDGTIGRAISPNGQVVIPDTPEHRAKAIALVDSIRSASKILAGLQETDYPAQYLMEISETWGQQPAQMELPLDKPTAVATPVDLSDL